MARSPRWAVWLTALPLLGSCAQTIGNRISAGPAEAVRASAGGEISGATWIGGAGRDEVFFADCGADGSVTLLGDTYRSFSRDSYELLAVRLGPDRRVEWAKTIGRGEKTQLTKAAHAADGGFVLLATTYWVALAPFPTTRHAELLLKLPAAAEPDWSVVVGPTKERAISQLIGVATTHDGGVVAVGSSVGGPSFQESEPAILAMDPRGQPAWSWRLPLGTPGIAHAVAVLPGGDLVVAGTVLAPGGKGGIFVARLAADGTPRWARSFSSSAVALAPRRVVAIGDAVAVLGQGGGGGSVDLVALRVSGDGALSWARRYADPRAKRVTPTALGTRGAGELVFAGSTQQSAAPPSRAGDPVAGRSGVLLAVGPDGELRLATAIGPDRDAEVRAVQALPDRRLCVAVAGNRAGAETDILVVDWTPPAEPSPSEFQAFVLDVRASEFPLHVEPLPYHHVPLPAGELNARALEVPVATPTGGR